MVRLGGGINLTCLLPMVVESGPCSLLTATPPRHHSWTGLVTFSVCSFQGLLNRNISVLLETLEESRQAEANLTARLRLKEGRKSSSAAMKGDVLRMPPQRYS